MREVQEGAASRGQLGEPEILARIPGVQRYRDQLDALGSQWDLLTMLGQMNEMGTDMSTTREAFQELTRSLLSQLGSETFKKVSTDLRSKAQVVVDILIRNLFERTADIGFLATDDDIRRYIVDEQREEGAMRQRFREYVRKYSVYDNIVLMDTSGRVLAQLDDGQPIERSDDPIVAESLSTKQEYVEVFRRCDLAPRRERALIYAYRVNESNSPGARALGVLCLVFRFENELEGIFNKLLDEGDWSVLCLLEPGGGVIASSDLDQVRVGAKVEVALGERCQVTRHAGRLYLSKTLKANGYQGFYGLGWMGHVMVPFEQAFEASDSVDYDSLIDADRRTAIEEASELFSAKLRSVPIQADSIQRDLERAVWNGSISDTSAQAKVLLRSISLAGDKTREVFRQSIGNLYATVFASLLKGVRFQSALAVDIMDRNLYERANDCRWWALNSEFRRLLSAGQISPGDRERMASILAYINGLYTVYTNLFLYDRDGVVLAVSDPSESALVSQRLDQSWMAEALRISDTQDYCVSSFSDTSLYGDRSTYIYNAAVPDARGSVAVGGIGIVFDSEPQFRSMLQDVLPRDQFGRILDGYFAVFAERSGRIVSCSSDRFQAGEKITISHDCLSGEKGSSIASVFEYDGLLYAVGSSVTAGYREYKVDDNYTNDIVCLVFAPLAPADSPKAALASHPAKLSQGFAGVRSPGESSIDVATFCMGGLCFGIEIDHVLEAIDSRGCTPMPNSPRNLKGIVMYEGKPVSLIDLRDDISPDRSGSFEQGCAILVRQDSNLLAFEVDSLGETVQLPVSQITREGPVVEEEGSFVGGVALPEARGTPGMLMIVDPVRLMGLMDDSLLSSAPGGF